MRTVGAGHDTRTGGRGARRQPRRPLRIPPGRRPGVRVGALRAARHLGQE